MQPTAQNPKKARVPVLFRKDIIAEANDIIQFQGDVLLVRNPHIIDKCLQERSTGMGFDQGYQDDGSQMDGAPGGHPCPSADGTARIRSMPAPSQELGANFPGKTNTSKVPPMGKSEHPNYASKQGAVKGPLGRFPLHQLQMQF